LLEQRTPSAAISVLTVYAIFYGMPVGAMTRGKEQNEIKNIVSFVLHGAPPQHAAPTVFAVTASLVSCCGNYSGICASKKKLKKELNACRRFEYSSDQGEQNI
jgi:hypothetical protein